ncbi:MAG: gamma-glutamyl-gamma-aminobutyrate hydrolase family protein [Kineosporiaceae bacterium]
MSAYAVPARWGVWDADAVLLPRAYVDAVAAAGGIPVLLPPLPGLIAGVLSRLDGLLLAGGPDVEPARYGQEAGPNTQPAQPLRDAAELDLLSAAVTSGLPVLAICRGMQLLNVARGGTLHQHLPDVLGNHDGSAGPGVYGTHPVTVAGGSRLAAALGRTEVDGVPAYHHQGVDVLGQGLIASAWAPDGLVEAIEDPTLPFCVGVQWHPEEGVDPALFRALVGAAREGGGP